MDFLRGTSDLGHTSPSDLLLLKFGMLALDYTCHATYLPTDFGRALQAPLIRRQADFALSRSGFKEQVHEDGEQHKFSQDAERDAG